MTLVAPSTAPFAILAPAGPSALTSYSRGLSVLLAEVAPGDAARLRWALEATGCDVSELTGALPDDLARVVLPDVVIAGEAGLGLAQAVAARAKLRQPFVVALTSPDDPEAGRRARAAGIHLAVHRPLDLGRLSGMLARFRSLLAGVEGFDPVI